MLKKKEENEQNNNNDEEIPLEEDEDDDALIGPQVFSVDAIAGRTNYGSGLLHGEGAALAHFVETE